MNKGLKWALVSLPILVGGFIVYQKLKPEKEKKKDDTPPPPPTPTNTSVGIGIGSGTYTKPTFPMGLGSRGAKVKELQQAIVDNANADVVKLLGKNPTDGSFGSGTEKAVKSLLGKVTVDSQGDIDRIKNIKNTIVGKLNREALANKQISLFKEGKRNFYTINDVQVANGEITTDGRDIKRKVTVVKIDNKIPVGKNASFKVKDGFIRAEYLSNGRNIFVEWSPYATEVK